MRLISTRTHGVLDYLTAGALVALPRALGWSRPVTRLLTGAAAMHVGYSLATNYELGLVKALLPRRGARLTLEQSGSVVEARLHLFPPSIREDSV